MSPFTPNLRLHDRYVLHDRIGLGGMSEVWRADDEVLGRPVAVKVLAGTFAVDPDLRATIRREARAAARLTHPHVTQVYDYAEATLDGGTVVPYLVMELVDGQNLADRLADGPLPWPQALRMAAQVAAALAAAHRLGVVHRDIKPGNVMLTETGAKVLDFGIAALAGPQHAGTRAAGEPMMGTPAYTAPERLSAGAPNPASDVYALGALLYRTLTGDVPLPVRGWEDAVAVHAHRPPVAPLRVPGLPADLAELVLACLDPDPAGRPTAGQLAARFRAGAAGPAGPSTAVLPIISTPAGAPAAPEPGPAQPPTLIDRAGSWSAAAAVPATGPAQEGDDGRWSATGGPGRGDDGRWSTADGPARGAARPVPATGRRPSRSRRSGPPVGALVAAGLALLVGLGAVLALGDRDGASPTATGTTSPPAPPTSTAPATPRPSATPSTARPEPVSLRQTAAEFVRLLTEAQLAGEIDDKAAEKLRKDLAKLASGKPKDREKRIEDLRKRLEDEVERGRLPTDFAERFDNLLDRLEATLPDNQDEDED
ncbi:serine/threonine protein kinase [Micromonospora craterilacus]|uniref:non-specific serine/threonine protein kinase n=1 Tax=Micromonospora craterilacus TaxID=1655439 RepID=A0A2W2EPE9_9ACTN|nr:serine/threonine-protein kinase [Micromonospora craterilacus]PZG18639.1 serine/threonine protein kinase [Micromonospora craterilacus]